EAQTDPGEGAVGQGVAEEGHAAGDDRRADRPTHQAHQHNGDERVDVRPQAPVADPVGQERFPDNHARTREGGDGWAIGVAAATDASELYRIAIEVCASASVMVRGGAIRTTFFARGPIR